MPEFKILNEFIDYMEATGSSRKLIRSSVDEDMLSDINQKHKTNFTLQDLQKAADKCFAHEWLEHTALGGGKYTNLSITPKGVGAVRSKNLSEFQKKSRSRLKKTSDYIEDHKGLFVLIGSVITIATLLTKLIGE